MPHPPNRRHATSWMMLALTLLLAQACTPQHIDNAHGTETFHATTGGY